MIGFGHHRGQNCYRPGRHVADAEYRTQELTWKELKRAHVEHSKGTTGPKLGRKNREGYCRYHQGTIITSTFRDQENYTGEKAHGERYAHAVARAHLDDNDPSNVARGTR